VATERTRRLIHDAEGLNTGTWPVPAGQFLTPHDDFFTRSHAPIPTIDPAQWRLEVDGLVRHRLSLSLTDLAQFPRQEVTATLVCAGLRRDELLSVGPLPGELPWGAEAAGTARWTGYSLRDLLERAELTPSARYVEFTGLDLAERDGRRFGFGGSIEVSKALDGEVVLATFLNGTPLAPAHGFPLRAVVPGWIGARSVKWLGRITLRERPSENYFQTRAYRFQREVNGRDPRDVSAGIALSQLAVNSVILEPTRHQVVSAGRLLVSGWALGTEGRALSRVELSADGGRSWTDVQLDDYTQWSWTLWSAETTLAPGNHSLVVRATDLQGNTQPADVAATWNVKGYANNAWHRVAVTAK
jgi:sulfite oxidase